MNTRNDHAVRDWYFRSLGTATLLEFASRPVFDFTAKLVEAKYKTPLILKLFRNIFDKAVHGPAIGRFGVLVIGDIPKAFGLEEYRNATLMLEPGAFSRDIGVLELFRNLMGRFDGYCPEGCCEARFRMGVEPPQSFVNRIAAMYWLRKTLDAAKAIQQKKAAPSRGLLVEERTVLENAFKQKSLLYFRLADASEDTAINPCYIKAIRNESMILQSPRGNRLNEAGSGHEVHGYFAITDRKQKSTYCDFRTNVIEVRAVDADYALVELALPAVFALTRRTHKRLPLNPSHLASFELSAPNLSADWNAFSTLEHWPAPFCIIPDGASQCHIRDLSAGGLMLEMHEEAPAYTYFVEGNKDYPLLAFLHLTGQVNLPDLKLGLRLEIKSIRDFPPLHKKYVGFQFTEAGEVRRDKLVRFTTVGKDGIFLINDWIFRNTIGR
ncbi:PilZ domain-containing protein [Solidesulfovibrio fructosivorans]|uniref:pilus assembly protein PilZ n=1 Tax=Solidesulfovibrio fructosivorans TaxID=878 RepID=UPI001F28CF3A|nr:pilus assembly protein PilZ [Solidesulfovibrio fructosivorans]